MGELFDQNRLRKIWDDSELWSCLGFEGLAFAFDISADNLAALSEVQKQQLMKLLLRLTKPLDEQLTTQLRRLEDLTPGERLVALRELSLSDSI